VRAQAALRAERDRRRNLFNTIAEGFALFDRDWNILEVNPEGLRIIRMRADDVIGKNHWELFPGSEQSAAGRLYLRAMQDRQPGTAEYCMRFPDGDYVWSEVRVYPTQDGGVASFFRDITDRKRAEEKLRAADQRKDEFLAMLAHELRNPLAPISAAADLLRVGRLDEGRVRQSSAIISRQVKHMTSLVNDLLDVSRVTRGLVTLSIAPVTTHGIVDEAVEQVLPLMQAREQQLTVFVADESATVLGDKARLVQVLANVLGNAAKYTPDRRNIELRAEVREGQLAITVRDEGIGMEPELTARVFELFAQAERSSDRSLGGLGLGLALVKNLVELHGGTVACSSPGPGKGSTFTIALPLMREASPQDEPNAPPLASAARRLKLMVVDDNVDAAETLAMLLEACGHEVIVEHGSLRALERASVELPDACLLDIGLPDIDGNEMARRLKRDRETAGIVLVAVTGYGQSQDREHAFDAGFRYHLVKPVDMARLEQVLAEIRR
jgi:PAS domain S-box-containing protein